MIRPLELTELALKCDAGELSESVSFSGVSIDSRRILPGELFVALRGENFDGHDYLTEVVSKGACGAVVEHQDTSIAAPQLVVDNTFSALGCLAELNRDLFDKPIIGVTGSSGKTTVKEMLSAILSINGKVLATRGNLNNHIGVPLMLLEIESQHDYAVIEMGASGLGEIDYLAGLAKPMVAVVNNVSSAHIEGFGSIENTATAKGEIYQGLIKGGVAVINLDDQFCDQWLAQNSDKKIITFSASKTADVTAMTMRSDEQGCFSFELAASTKKVKIQLPLIGKHNINNALAASACCIALGLDLDVIKRGLESVGMVAGRMQRKIGKKQSIVIDDSYNANPDSVSAAIDMLSDVAGKKVLVLGDMAELGEDTVSLHRQVGVYANQRKIDVVLTVGEFSKETAKAINAEGGNAQHFSAKKLLISACLKLADETTTFLVKGSRSAAMEEVVAALEINQVV